MARVHFELETSLAPQAVLGVLTDFSERRAEVWPNIDRDHFKVHGQGPGWADVTEGSARGGGIWERNRYEWLPAADRVTVTTTESNTWKPGSRWDYRFRPLAGGGTKVSVDVLRTGRGVKGTLLGLFIGLVGARVLRRDLTKVLAAAAGPETKPRRQ
jgi:hypothetical protein